MPQKRGGSKNTKRESTRETLFNLPASPLFTICWSRSVSAHHKCQRHPCKLSLEAREEEVWMVQRK